jgi:hypothetical protein
MECFDKWREKKIVLIEKYGLYFFAIWLILAEFLFYYYGKS